MCPMCWYSGPLGALHGNLSKGVSKTEVANIKAKNATIAFPLHVLSSIPPRSFKFIFPLLFLRWCDFLAYRAQFTASFVRFVSKKTVRYTIFTRFYTQAEASRVLAYDWLDWNNQPEKALQPKPESTGHTLAGINKSCVGKTFLKRNKFLNGLLVVQYVNFKIFYAIFVIFN